MYTPQVNKTLLNGRNAVAAASIALLGVAALAVPAAHAANVTTTTAKPSIVLATLDTDIVAVSGRNFAPNTKVKLSAVASIGKGAGEVDVNKDGRILLGFQVPAGYKGDIAVTASTPAATASIKVDVPDVKSPGYGGVHDDSGITVPKEVAAATNGDKLDALVASYNDKIHQYNALTSQVEKASNADKAKIDAANASITATNSKAAELNVSIGTVQQLISKKASDGDVNKGMEKAIAIATDANTSVDKALIDLKAAKDSASTLKNA